MKVLFNQKTIEKHAESVTLVKKQIESAHEWLNMLKNNELEDEVSNYNNFYELILRNVLGYERENIINHKNNVEYQIKGKSGKSIICMELKGTKTKDLNADQHRYKEHQRTPISQTQFYMWQLGLDYGVCSNYRKFIMLDRNNVTHEFDFMSIENNKEKLKEFITVFSKSRIVDKSIDELRNDSIIEEKEFTKEFYKLFHETRLMLIKSFQDKENVSKTDAIYYSQIFLNRLIFIFFVEDMTDNRIFYRRVMPLLETSQLNKHSKKIYEDIIELFKIFDKGEDELKIFGYNGGLFSEEISSKVYFDDIRNKYEFKEIWQHSKLLKSTKLNENAEKIVKKYPDLNPIISNLLIMDSFDFNTEVNVNILGHIFEQSISDLEELQKEGGMSKRKKDGVYYTPEYITDYVCRNTIIPYLSKSGKITNVYDLVDEYSDNLSHLEQKFQSIKILDPACGSGAFLVKAVEVLLDIYRTIHEHKLSRGEYTKDGQLQLTKWSDETKIRDIITNNIFGVDVNDESVGITKLSLFLMLATGNKKLSDLSKNIKIGNSLVLDKDVDPKAFDWNKEFSDIINNGGFDIIIGNPPYIRVQRIDHKIIDYLLLSYCSAHKKFDISMMFFEKSLSLTKKHGLISFISSSQWLNTDYGEKLREMLSKGLIKKLINFGSLPIFDDVSTYPAIFIFGSNIRERMEYVKIDDATKLSYGGISSAKSISLHYSQFGNKAWSFNELNLITHLDTNNIDWNHITQFGNFYTGLLTGLDDVFVVSKAKIKKYDLESNLLYPYAYQGKEVRQYGETLPSEMVIYPYDFNKDSDAVLLSEDRLKKLAPNIFQYLKTHKSKLEKRMDSRKYYAAGKNWYKLVRPGKFTHIQPEKLIIKGIDVKPTVGFLKSNTAFNGANSPAFIITNNKYNLWTFIAILNSNIISYYLRSICPSKLHGFFRFNTNSLNTIPIPNINKSFVKQINPLSHEIVNLTEEFNSKHQVFLDRIMSNFEIRKMPRKFQKFYVLEFTSFYDELKKHSKQLTLKEQDELQNYFVKYKNILLNLQNQIQKMNYEINQMVYKLYHLTNEEIQIVEESIKK